MKMLIGFAALAVASVGCCLPVLAQQGPGPQTPEQRAERFDDADANKDGKLNKDEFVAMLPDRAKDFADQIWERLDADADGEVSKEQFLAMQPRQ